MLLSSENNYNPAIVKCCRSCSIKQYFQDQAASAACSGLLLANDTSVFYFVTRVTITFDGYTKPTIVTALQDIDFFKLNIKAEIR